MPEVRSILLRKRGNTVLHSEYFFLNNILRSWYTLLKKVGIENFRWHDIRHCCTSYLRQDGKSLGLIGKLETNFLPVPRVMNSFMARKLW